MTLRRVKTLFIDDDGRLIADADGMTRAVVGITHHNGDQAGGYPVLNGNGKVPANLLPSSVANQNNIEEPRVRLNRAALRLLATQNSDHGWPWMNPDTNPAHGVPSPANTLGVSARGILDCYLVSQASRCLDACKAVYTFMALNSEDPDPSKHRIRGPDIGFLACLSEASGNPNYASFARARWDSAKGEFGGGTATGFAEFIRDARKGQGLPALISWDINLYIQSLLCLNRYFPNEGFDTQAKQMAEVIYDSLYVAPVDFDITDDSQNEFWNGISGALEAFVTTGVHPTEKRALATQLEGGQEDDGHFPGVVDGSDAQTTAYAVTALLHAAKDRSAVAAVNYLVSTQLANGGWLYDGGENTEVTSEAAHALYSFTE